MKPISFPKLTLPDQGLFHAPETRHRLSRRRGAPTRTAPSQSLGQPPDSSLRPSTPALGHGLSRRYRGWRGWLPATNRGRTTSAPERRELVIIMKRRRTALAAVVGVSLGAIGTASGTPAAADIGNGPSSAGIVERFDSPGFSFVPDFEDGLVVFANVNSIADACNGIPAGAGVEQLVFTPNGRVNGVLQDDDVPVIVAPLGPAEVVCGDPAAWPVIATGTGNVRAGSGGFHLTGTVEEPDGQLWNVQAAFKPNGPDVNLVKRGQ